VLTLRRQVTHPSVSSLFRDLEFNGPIILEAPVVKLDGSAGTIADPLGRGNEVCVMAFSEFGRRVAENANLGTDHGTAGPVFIAGKRVKGGHYGRMLSLVDLSRFHSHPPENITLQKPREADHLLGRSFDQDTEFFSAPVMIKAAIYELLRLRWRHWLARKRKLHYRSVREDVVM
jgi:hypothetical protein